MEFKLKPAAKEYIETLLPRGYSLHKGGAKELLRKEKKALKKVHIEPEPASSKVTRREGASELSRSQAYDYQESKGKSKTFSNKEEDFESIPMTFSIPKPNNMSFVIPKPEKVEIGKAEENLNEEVSGKDKNEKGDEEISQKNSLHSQQQKPTSSARPLRPKKPETLIKFPFKSAIDIERNGDAFQKGMFNIVQILKGHKSSLPFLKPIDFGELPDYLDIIEKPMDLASVERKVLISEYKSMEEFVEDCLLIWNNAKKYNAPYSVTYSQAVDMDYAFELLVKRFEAHYQKYEGVPEFYKFKRKIQSLSTKAKKLFTPKPLPQRDFISRQPQEDLALTQEEKDERLALSRNIKKLPPFVLRNIPDFIDFGDDNDIEIDIQRLSNEDFETLKAFIEMKIKAFSWKELEKVDDSGGSGWSSGSDSNESIISLLLS